LWLGLVGRGMCGLWLGLVGPGACAGCGWGWWVEGHVRVCDWGW
jgi:hypothetical protein